MDDDEQWQKTHIMTREEKKRPSKKTKEGVKTNEDNETKGRIYDPIFLNPQYDLGSESHSYHCNCRRCRS